MTTAILLRTPTLTLTTALTLLALTLLPWRRPSWTRPRGDAWDGSASQCRQAARRVYSWEQSTLRRIHTHRHTRTSSRDQRCTKPRLHHSDLSSSKLYVCTTRRHFDELGAMFDGARLTLCQSTHTQSSRDRQQQRSLGQHILITSQHRPSKSNTRLMNKWRFIVVLQLCSCTVTMGGSVAQWLGRWLVIESREFNSRPVRYHVTTLGKLFTPMCLCHQAV